MNTIEVDAGNSQWSWCGHCSAMMPADHSHASDDPDVEGWSGDVDGGVSGLNMTERLLRESYQFLGEC